MMLVGMLMMPPDENVYDSPRHTKQYNVQKTQAAGPATLVTALTVQTPQTSLLQGVVAIIQHLE
jgi:hypothetical protein